MKRRQPLTHRPIRAPGVVIVGATAAILLAGCSPAGGPAAGSSAAPPATTAPAAESNPPGDIADNQVFVDYTAPDGSFTVKYPEGWARTDTVAGTVAFSDGFNGMTLAPHLGFYQSDEAFARSVEIPQIASTTPGFALGSVSTVQRPAGPVLLITYRADSPPSPVTGKSVTLAVQRYEFSKLGRGVVVTLSAPVGADNVDPWRVVTDSFTWLPR